MCAGGQLLVRPRNVKKRRPDLCFGRFLHGVYASVYSYVVKENRSLLPKYRDTVKVQLLNIRKFLVLEAHSCFCPKIAVYVGFTIILLYH